MNITIYFVRIPIVVTTIFTMTRLTFMPDHKAKMVRLIRIASMIDRLP